MAIYSKLKCMSGKIITYSVLPQFYHTLKTKTSLPVHYGTGYLRLGYVLWFSPTVHCIHNIISISPLQYCLHESPPDKINPRMCLGYLLNFTIFKQIHGITQCLFSQRHWTSETANQSTVLYWLTNQSSVLQRHWTIVITDSDSPLYTHSFIIL